MNEAKNKIAEILQKEFYAREHFAYKIAYAILTLPELEEHYTRSYKKALELAVEVIVDREAPMYPRTPEIMGRLREEKIQHFLDEAGKKD